jgi:hypothetical protein
MQHPSVSVCVSVCVRVPLGAAGVGRHNHHVLDIGHGGAQVLEHARLRIQIVYGNIEKSLRRPMHAPKLVQGRGALWHCRMTQHTPVSV